jgi:hypothetical protein
MRDLTVYSGGHDLDKKSIYERVMRGESYDGADNSSNTVANAGTTDIEATRSSMTNNSVYSVNNNTNSSSSSSSSSSSAAPDVSRVAVGLLAATSFRDRLLERARKTGFRPQIRDEQSDFYEFEGNQWLSSTERADKARLAELAEEAVNDMRREYTLDLDLGQGTAVVGAAHGAERHFMDARGVGELKDKVEAEARARLEAEHRDRDARAAKDAEPSQGSTVVADASKKYSLQSRQVASASRPAFQNSDINSGMGGDVEAVAAPRAHMYTNDTLNGRARLVYDSIKKLIKDSVADSTNSDNNSKMPPSTGPSRRVQWADDAVESEGVGSFDAATDTDNSVAAGCVVGGGGGDRRRAWKKASLASLSAAAGAKGWGGPAWPQEDLEDWVGPELELAPEPEPQPQPQAQAGLSLGLGRGPASASAPASSGAPASRWAQGGGQLGYQAPEDLALGDKDDGEASFMSAGALAVSQALLSSRISPNYAKYGYGDAGDLGICLSMHQPWASLLVHGIKRFEGRGWSTGFRGRLWIASTAKKAEDYEVEELEQQYKEVYGEDSRISFPKRYPSAALLGCVDMVGCWTHEEFDQYKTEMDGKARIEGNQSLNVFVCTNPRVLPTPVSITGQHKLWSLPANLHKGLAGQLKPVNDNIAHFVIKQAGKRYTEEVSAEEALSELKPKKKNK